MDGDIQFTGVSGNMSKAFREGATKAGSVITVNYSSMTSFDTPNGTEVTMNFNGSLKFKIPITTRKEAEDFANFANRILNNFPIPKEVIGEKSVENDNKPF